MGENPVITSIFSEFQKNFDQEQELRDVIRSISKEMDPITREATTILQVIHHNESAIMQACAHVRELFEKAKEGYARLKEVVPSAEYYKYHDQWRFMTQRFCFLIALTVWLEKGILVSLVTTAEILGLSSKETTTTFHLDIEDYLIGLLSLATELSRFAINTVTRGDYNKPIQISKFIMELNAGFRLLNLKNDHLRKRFDSLKYDVKKIEEVVYDLSIRGLLPKTQEPAAPSTVA